MKFEAKKGQTSYGEVIGILLLDTFCPFIQGDVGNATSYRYPVRFKRIDGLTTDHIFAHDLSYAEKMIDGARELEREGVRAITGDCGFMALYQKEVKAAVTVPVFLTSLLQIPFIRTTLPDQAKVGVLTANSKALTPDVLEKIGLDDSSLVLSGLEDARHFREVVYDETGVLDSDEIRKEVVGKAQDLIKKHPEVKSILLECSLLPPYGDAVQRATGLPVFDFLTMIDFVYSSLVKKRFDDVM